MLPYEILFQEFHQRWHLGEMSRRVGSSGLFPWRGPALMLLWTLVAFVLTATFGSNLNAAFVVRSFEKPVETLEEMLQR